jgi:ABC-type sugar transport system substrate-binding protein
MNIRNVVIGLITRENDYQAEQSASALQAASRLGVKVTIVYADNNAVNQSQQLVKIIQDKNQRPDAILVEPIGTTMHQVARAAVAAGIGWGVLNREADYISELRRSNSVPVFAVSPDQVEVGRIQGEQMSILAKEGNILYLEGPSSSSVASLRTRGMLSSKPNGVELKVIKGDWSERSGHHAVSSWLSLSTSSQIQLRAVVSQNDAMAMGAKKAFSDLGEATRSKWLNTPFIGCDGVPATGQRWVRTGQLRATIVIPPMAGMALEILAKAISSGTMPPERTLSAPHSFPDMAEIKAQAATKYSESLPHSMGR